MRALTSPRENEDLDGVTEKMVLNIVTKYIMTVGYFDLKSVRRFRLKQIYFPEA